MPFIVYAVFRASRGRRGCALVLSIGAGATGVFKSASDAFAGVFGPTADTEIIDQIGRPIGASDTAGGVTVTADAILFDGYNYLISYTLEKEDGSAFDCTKNPDTGLLNVYWNRADSNIGLNAQAQSAVAISMTKIRMIMPFSMLKPCRTLTQLRPVVQQRLCSAT